MREYSRVAMGVRRIEAIQMTDTEATMARVIKVTAAGVA